MKPERSDGASPVWSVVRRRHIQKD
jgi:hypothetical protein